jgi:UDP-N-acetylmuramate--alanine ligase
MTGSEVVHLIGIGGVGMSAVAELLVGAGVEVSGCDGRDSATLARLRRLGVATRVGHDPAHLDGVDRVVFTTAIKPDNLELAAARARPGLLVQHRSEALADVANARRLVAVAGTHGKTTTSAMVVAALEAAGFEPSYAIGSELIGRGSGARAGRDDIMVIEADESDESFLNYSPLVAIVTNIEADHLDHYPSAEAYAAAFRRFVDRVRPGGALIACAADRGAASLLAEPRPGGPELIGYGLDGGWGDLGLVGRHLALNAEAAGLAAQRFGVDRERARAGLAAFAGAARRFERRGQAGGVAVYDDYAHHPTEIAATLAAARQQVGPGRLLVVFQPHLYSRTRQFAAEFGSALAGGADQVWLLDVYGAREDPMPGVDSGLIAAAMPPGRVTWARDRAEVPAAVAAAARPGDIVFALGAGDVTELVPAILSRLKGRP